MAGSSACLSTQLAGLKPQDQFLGAGRDRRAELGVRTREDLGTPEGSKVARKGIHPLLLENVGHSSGFVVPLEEDRASI